MEENNQIEEEKLYTLRDLKSKDLFPMSGILGKIGIKEFKEYLDPEKTKELMRAFSSEHGDDDREGLVQYVGINVVFEIVDVILGNLPKCEKDLYKFLSGLSGLSCEEIEELPMATFFEMLVDVVKKEEFKDFFKVVSKSFGQAK